METEEEVVTRLSRVGFDNVLGYLDGGFQAWADANKEIDTVDRISAHQLQSMLEEEEVTIYDVRKLSEYEAEHIEDAYNKPLAAINDWIKDIDSTKPFVMHCAGGYRSMIAASILLSRGFRLFKEVEGGFNAIKKEEIKITDFVCQSKVMS